MDVPAGSTAEAHLPLVGGAAPAPEGARKPRVDGDEAVYAVGSGRCTFRSAC